MIWGFTGPLGGGKSLSAVIKAYHYSLKAGGVPIWANMPLHMSAFRAHKAINPYFKIGFLQTPDDIVRMVAEGGGILVFDEIHQNIDSRLSTSMVQAFVTQWLAFLRKQRITCFYTTQHEEQIDKRMRYFTDLITVCLSFGPRRSKDFWFRTSHTMTKSALKEEKLRTLDVQHYFTAYNTDEITERIQFPGTQKTFDVFLHRVKEAQRFAREYKGTPDRAWETFVSQTRDTESEAAAGSKKVPPAGGLRKSPSRRKRAGGEGDSLQATELATEAG